MQQRKQLLLPLPLPLRVFNKEGDEPPAAACDALVKVALVPAGAWVACAVVVVVVVVMMMVMMMTMMTMIMMTMMAMKIAITTAHGTIKIALTTPDMPCPPSAAERARAARRMTPVTCHKHTHTAHTPHITTHTHNAHTSHITNTHTMCTRHTPQPCAAPCPSCCRCTCITTQFQIGLEKRLKLNQKSVWR